MRISRRNLLAGGLSLAALPLSTAHAKLSQPTTITIRATPIRAFLPRDPDRRRFGALHFRSGLQLSSSHNDFGGWSGLSRSADGSKLIAISDRATWLTAKIERDEHHLIGLSEASLAPILGADGHPLTRTRSYDTEGLSIVNGVASVSIERSHEVRRFDWAGAGVMAKGHPIPVPREAKRLRSNKSLEAVGVVPSNHALAGAVIAIAERSGEKDEPTRGFIVDGPRPGLFQVQRHNGFEITDLAFLPNGDMLILERWFKLLHGVKMRIRRIAGHSIKPGALLDGETLIEADMGYEIDNMEGLAVHHEAGRTILTLISDDNFSMIQRTILLEFELASPSP